MKLHTKTVFATTVLAALLGMCIPLSAHASQTHGHDSMGALGASKITRTDAALRDLWLGHAFWVRTVAVATLSGDGAATAAAEAEAVNNAKLLAASMEPYYGKAAAGEVFKLLAGHYGAVKQYLLAAHATDTAGQEAGRQAMLRNAEEIATFLSSANPHLPIDGLRGMLLAHGGHHILQIQQMIGKQHVQEAQTWEAMKDHMYAIADALTLAIAKQFPGKFK